MKGNTQMQIRATRGRHHSSDRGAIGEEAREEREREFFSTSQGHSRKVAICQPQRGPSLGNKFSASDIPASRSDVLVCCFSHPVYGYFAMAAQVD